IFDRAVGLLSLLLLSLALVPAFPHLVWSVVDLRFLVLIDLTLTVGLLIGFLIVLLDGSWANRLLRKVLGWMPWKELPRRVFDAISFYRGSVSTLFAALGASLLANLSVVCVAALARFALAPSSFALRVFLVAPMGYIANSLPLTPGGLGVGEEAFNSLFKLMGLGGGADVLLGWRVWSLPVSIVGLVCYLRGLGRSVHHEEEPVV
ncbi:MAG: lysylphosphatidylglycerol synthase domain-containing protein, partial [Candidatus Acidiferrales bacterium]